MNAMKRLTPLALALVLAGCVNLAPKYERPAAPVAAAFPTVAGTVNSGNLEMSNANLAQQFTDMIRAQRGFQANSKMITTSDEMLQELIALKR